MNNIWVNEGCIERLQKGLPIMLILPAHKKVGVAAKVALGNIVGVKEPSQPAVAVCIWTRNDKLARREKYEGFHYNDGVWNFPDMPDYESLPDTTTDGAMSCKPLIIKEVVGKHITPADFLPENGIRLFVKVTDISLRKIQDLQEDDAIAAGYPDGPPEDDSPLELFSQYWEKTYAANRKRDMTWYANPDVKVIKLTPCTPF